MEEEQSHLLTEISIVESIKKELLMGRERISGKMGLCT